MLTWVGNEYDPEYFDADMVNERGWRRSGERWNALGEEACEGAPTRPFPAPRRRRKAERLIGAGAISNILFVIAGPQEVGRKSPEGRAVDVSVAGH